METEDWAVVEEQLLFLEDSGDEPALVGQGAREETMIPLSVPVHTVSTLGCYPQFPTWQMASEEFEL